MEWGGEAIFMIEKSRPSFNIPAFVVRSAKWRWMCSAD
jgi:hypothetical protein